MGGEKINIWNHHLGFQRIFFKTVVSQLRNLIYQLINACQSHAACQSPFRNMQGLYHMDSNSGSWPSWNLRCWECGPPSQQRCRQLRGSQRIVQLDAWKIMWSSWWSRLLSGSRHCDIIYTGENLFVLRYLTNFLLFSSYLKMETGYINRYDTLSQHTFKMRACDYARISRSINSIWAIQSSPWILHCIYLSPYSHLGEPDLNIVS